MRLAINLGRWICAFFVLAETAASCWSAMPPQSQQESSSTEKQESLKSQRKEKETQAKQDFEDSDSDPDSISHQGFKGLAEDFLTDQKQIWTSPAKARLSDMQWLVPLAGVSAGLFATDSAVSSRLPRNPGTLNRYSNVSNAGLAALVGGAGGMWLMGHVRHNTHWTETGFLAGEAALNTVVVTEALKYSFSRERPFQDNGTGPFFQGGTSFPSQHAAVSWAVAGVIAHEYPGPLTKIAVYGLATLVDFSRVRSRQHFPSDVFIGDVIGNLIAQDIYTRHHDPELGGDAWRSMSSMMHDLSASPPSVPASPFVPLDSWVYPAIERLGALGFIDSMFLGSRPWTRVECSLLIQEAGERIAENERSNSEAQHIYEQLYGEFHHDMNAAENGGENLAKIESLYTSTTEISGTPLNDSDHFGQTIINNFGRPYEQGFNTVDGFSAWAADGRYAVYVRGEYEHAPSAPGFSQPIQNLIGRIDVNPPLTASPISATDQFRLLDTYVSTVAGGWNFSFGKQSLWWGQGEGGALIFSDNAAPIYMFRASRNVPFLLPWIFRYLGKIKVDAFVGKLSGNQFPARPILHGEKITFKPTKNLEIAFSRLSEMGGAAIPGVNAAPNATFACPFGNQRPITTASVFNSYFSFRESSFYQCGENPGKRTAGFEFSYRLPFLRNWVTIYTDSLAPDDPSPIAAPRRAAVEPGIYVSHFPGLSKLDLHVEAAATDTPSSSTGGQYLYFDNFYHDLSTNEGNLIGSWIGRQGVGLQAWSNYWVTPRTSIQVSYRHAKVAGAFIPDGETLNDASASATFWVRREFQVSASVQYEKWLAPVLSPAAQTNWTSSIAISYQPHKWSMPFHQSGNSGKETTP